MAQQLYTTIIAGLKGGSIVPYLGAGALKGSIHTSSGAHIPASSDELILAINRGKPMASKLMYEFPRAAMHMELKSGRSRSFPIHPDLLKVLQGMPRVDAYVFHGPRGGRLKPDTVRRILVREVIDH